jgi:hypothetical protein
MDRILEGAIATAEGTLDALAEHGRRAEDGSMVRPGFYGRNNSALFNRWRRYIKKVNRSAKTHPWRTFKARR